MSATGIGAFSFDVAKRILDALKERGNMKRTNLATKAGLNYAVCMRYIEMLSLLGWIKVDPEISITEDGRKVCRSLAESSQIMAARRQRQQQPQQQQQPSDRPPRMVQARKTRTAAAARPARAEIPEPVAAGARGISRKKRGGRDTTANIMIVDDEQDVALTFESFLSTSGYSARAFSDPFDALREFVSSPSLYDLVILDIRMPDMNGLQLYQSLKAMNPGCRFVFISSLDAASELVSIFPGIRPQDVVRKPVDREYFMQTVRAALKH